MLAAAVAFALIEIVMILIPRHAYTVTVEPKETITIAKLTRIEHRVVHTPKPKPTPQPVVHTKVIAPTHVKPSVVNPGNPSRQQHIKRISQAAPTVRTHYHSKPVEHVPMGAQGAGTSKKATALNGSVGTGGSGTGQSGQGQGTGGAPAAHEPCGYVDFIATGNPTVDRSTGRVWEYIQMIVHFPDGSEQSVDLDYPWYYASDEQDPWSDYNEKKHPNEPVPFQFPPAGQTASEPPLVQYVIQHTSADGYTRLHPCAQ